MLQEENKWHLILRRAMPHLRLLVTNLSPQKFVFSPRPVYVEIYDGQSATGTGSSPHSSVFCLVMNPPTLYTYSFIYY
jgi:hypothetical protein